MRVVQHADDESASDSSSSEDEEEVRASASESGDESDSAEAAAAADDAALPALADEAPRSRAALAPSGRAPGKKIKLTLANHAAGACKACGSTAHAAGFQGAVYVDCPDRPCYLCKKARLASAARRGAARVAVCACFRR